MRLVLMLKAQGKKIAHQAGYYFYSGHWHKIDKDNPAPAHVPVSSHPEAAGKFTPTSHFSDEQWEMLKLPDTNVNAKAVNKKIDELKHYSDTGNVAAILGMSIGSNTYGKQIAIIANKLLDMYGVPHQVTHGQKAGMHPAVAHKDEPAAESKPAEPTKPEPKKEAPKPKPKPKAEPKPAPAVEPDRPSGAVGKVEKLDNWDAKFQVGMIDLNATGAQKDQMEDALTKPSDHKVAIKGVEGEITAAGAFNLIDGVVKITHLGSTGNGQGKAIVDYVKHFAKVNQAKTIKLDSTNNAVGFYKKMGFTATGENNKMTLALGGEAAGESKAANKAGQKEAKSKPATPDAERPGDVIILDNWDAKFQTGMIADGVPGGAKSYMEDALMQPADKKVAIHDDEGGITAVASFSHDGDIIKIHHIGSSGNGQGKKLIDFIKDYAAKNGVKAIKLDSSTYGLEFYKKMGFVVPDAKASHAMVFNVKPEAKPAAEKPAKTAKAKADKAAPAKPQTTEEEGPQEGQTKPGANGGTLVFHNGHWHKQDEPAATEPAAAENETKPQSAKQLLDGIEFDKDKLPESNSNAKTHNAAIEKIKAMAYAGDLDGLKAFHAKKSQAKQNYAKKQGKLAEIAIAALEEGGASQAAEPAAEKAGSSDGWAVSQGYNGNSHATGNVGGTFVALSYLKDDNKIAVIIGSNSPKYVTSLSAALSFIADKLDTKAGAKLPPMATLNTLAEQSGGAMTPIKQSHYQLIAMQFDAAVAKVADAGKKPKAKKIGQMPDGWALMDLGSKDGADSYGLEKDLGNGASIKLQCNGNREHIDVTVNGADGGVLTGKFVSLTTAASFIGESSAKLTGGKGELPPKAALTTLAEISDGNLKPVSDNQYDALTSELADYNTATSPGHGAPQADDDGTSDGIWSVGVGSMGDPTPSLIADVDGKYLFITKVGSGYNAGAIKLGKGGGPDMKTYDTFTEAAQAMATLVGKSDVDAPSLHIMNKLAAAAGEPALSSSEWKAMLAGDTGAQWEVDKSDMGLSGATSLKVSIGDSFLYVGYTPQDGYQVGAITDADVDGETGEYLTFPGAMVALIDKAAELGGEPPSYDVMKQYAAAVGAKPIVKEVWDMAVAAHKANKPQVGAGPHDGDTKQGADGVLVFRDGHWHKQAKAGKTKPTGSSQPQGSQQPEAMDAWEQVGGQLGSNAGGKFKDKTGQEWYCKFPKNEHIAKAEVLAAKLYALAGIAGQDAKLITKDGKVGIASKWTEVSKATPGQLAKNKTVLEGFAVDAWLANWDVVGLGYDNLQHDQDGNAVRVDAGGSLMYRAQGGKKEFGDHVPEIDTLRDPAVNPQAAAVFGKISTADITASVMKVLQLSDEDIMKAVINFGPGDLTEKEQLANTLIARKASLAEKFPKAVKMLEKQKEAKPAKPPVYRIPDAPDFKNWHGPGHGLSSKAPFNEQNQELADKLHAAGLKGDVAAVSNMTYQTISETGAAQGDMKPIAEHPSQHIPGYQKDVMAAMKTPYVSTKDMLRGMKQKLSFGFVAIKELFPGYAKLQESAKKLGRYAVLGKMTGDNPLAKWKPTKLMSMKQGNLSNQVLYDASKASFAKLSQTEQNAIRDYTGSSYNAMNSAIIKGENHDKAYNAIKGLEKASVPIPVGSVISRRFSFDKAADGTDNHENHVKAMKALLAEGEGAILQEFGLISTSTNSGTWGGRVHLKITCGEGVKGLYVASNPSGGGGAISKHPGENEIILPYGTKFMVTKIHKNGHSFSDEHGDWGKKSGDEIVIEVTALPNS